MAMVMAMVVAAMMVVVVLMLTAMISIMTIVVTMQVCVSRSVCTLDAIASIIDAQDSSRAKSAAPLNRLFLYFITAYSHILLLSASLCHGPVCRC
jgi:hypothetical protein